MTKPFVNVAYVPLSRHPAARPGTSFNARSSRIAVGLRDAET
jgi:hypothetical protein